MADTHLSIETTYIAYPICYTMMLPNMPFRKADAHPLRLNTRCKDLTLVPSRGVPLIHFNRIVHCKLTILGIPHDGNPQKTHLTHNKPCAARGSVPSVFIICSSRRISSRLESANLGMKRGGKSGPGEVPALFSSISVECPQTWN